MNYIVNNIRAAFMDNGNSFYHPVLSDHEKGVVVVEHVLNKNRFKITVSLEDDPKVEEMKTTAYKKALISEIEILLIERNKKCKILKRDI